MCKLPNVAKRFSVLAVCLMPPTGSDVTGASYENQEVQIPLKDGTRLHVVAHQKRLKLTLVNDMGVSMTKGVKLSSVSLETMENAVVCGFLQVDSRTLHFANTRLIRRLLNRVKK